MEHERELIAFRLTDWPLPRPAPREREWMDDTPARFANRCLPLLIANQYGWDLICPHAVHACWDGSPALDGIRVVEHTDQPGFASSHFGSGILTFHVGFLFRTPPGVDLLVKGPANRWKASACALEGVVETEWAHATFTMNWRMTEPHRTVTFEAGEPYATVVPLQRDLVQSLRPVARPIAAEPELESANRAWSESRDRWADQSAVVGTTSNLREWQREYYVGQRADGTVFPEHRVRLGLEPFREEGEVDSPPI